MGDSSGDERALQIDVGQSETAGAGKGGEGGGGRKKKSSRPPVNWKPGEIVWSKVSGFSFWPAKVFDANNDKLVPDWMKPSPKQTYILVRFFGTYDMQWVSGTSTESYEKGLKKRFHTKSKSKSFLKAVKEAKEFVDSGVLPEGLTQRPLDPAGLEEEEEEETEKSDDKSTATSQGDEDQPQSGSGSNSSGASGGTKSRRKGAPRKLSSSSAEVGGTPSKKKMKLDNAASEEGESKRSGSGSDEVKAFTSAPLPQTDTPASADGGEEERKKEDKADKLTNGEESDKTEEKSAVEA